jgi:hypothetical protein
MDHQIRKRFIKNPLYVLTEKDCEKIEGFIEMLHLAISEIIAQKNVYYDDSDDLTLEQDTFNQACYDVIESKKSSPN